jgi:hypothetical protein
MIFKKSTLSIVLLGMLLAIMTENTVKANCGCARCNRMQQLSPQWYQCCLYCVVNGKRSASDLLSFQNRHESDDDNSQEMSNDPVGENFY